MEEESSYLERDTPEAQLVANLLDDLKWIESNPDNHLAPSSLEELSEWLREANLDDISKKQLVDLLTTARKAEGSSDTVKAFIEFFLKKLGVNLEKALQKPAPFKVGESVQNVIDRVNQRQREQEAAWADAIDPASLWNW